MNTSVISSNKKVYYIAVYFLLKVSKQQQQQQKTKPKKNKNKKQKQTKKVHFTSCLNKDQFIVSFTLGNYGGIEIVLGFSASGYNLPERGVRLLYVGNQYRTWPLYGHNVNKSQSLDLKKHASLKMSNSLLHVVVHTPY